MDRPHANGGDGSHRWDDDHVRPLDHGWSVWRRVALRGAGFPAAMLDSLTARETVDALDHLERETEAVSAARQQAITALDSLLENLEGPERRPLTRAIVKLRKKKTPQATPELGDARVHIERLVALQQRVVAANEECERRFADDQQRLAEALRQTSRDPRFREAIVWQNRGALPHIIKAMSPGAKGWRARQYGQLVARYLQRYCAKNDTIGFFGPLGWLTLESNDADASLKPGDQLLARRTVYFEHWPLIALAEILARDARTKPQLAPRRSTAFWLDGDQLLSRQGQLITLPAEIARLLAACDGRRSARSIARALGSDPEADFDDEDEVYAVLEDLEAKSLVIWNLEVPIDRTWPVRDLIGMIERLEGPEPERIRAGLETLESKRADVARAAGDAVALDRALGELDTAFERIADQEATRRHGENYAGRTLVFEDCERDLQLRLGPSFTQRFGSALSLVLLSARSLSYGVAARLSEKLEAAYDALRQRSGSDVIEFSRVFDRIPSLAHGMQSSDRDDVGEVLVGIDSRWRAILDFGPSETRVHRTSEALAPAVRDAFSSPGPGWPGARHHSVDLMVGARSFDAVAAGDCMVVLGEVHPGGTQLVTPVFVRGIRDPEVLYEAYRRGVDTSQQVHVPHSRQQSIRTVCGPGLKPEFVLDGAARYADPPRAVSTGELVAERSGPDSRLVVRTRDGRAWFDAVAFCQSWLGDGIADRFSILQPQSHTPRVSIDGLVVQRETWRMAPEELEFSGLDRGLGQFAAARRWARERGIPRWCFVKIPEEGKPVYVDFDSPVYVEALAKLAREASRVTLSEMIPSLDELWLPDAEGNLYTCEFRMIAVDPIAWTPPERS